MRNTILPILLALVMTGCPGQVSARPEPVNAEDLAPVVKANTAFACNLYARLAAEEGNLFLSPYSISSALAMTLAGARGETAAQMANTLCLPSQDEAVHAALATLQRSLQTGEDLHIANALWGQKGVKFLDTFLDLVKTNYGAGLENVDFEKATEKARKTINAWVEDKTQDKIQELLKPGVLDPATRLVLTNAIYFKGAWEEPFDKKRTREMPFHTAPGHTADTDFMYQKHGFPYAETEAFQALEMPYAGRETAMLILLPREAGGLAALEQNLSPEMLDECVNALGSKEVQVFLPKFTTTSEFGLKPTLSAMGMPLAFDGAADFSGMTGRPELFISAVVHKAFVDVAEEGTEAAAATAVIMAKAAAPGPPHEIPVFRADHPFLFIIRDTRTGNILFLGRFVAP